MIFIGGRSYRMGATSLDVTIDPVVVTQDGRVVETGPGALITGERPPLVPRAWWPWIFLVLAGGAVYWLVKSDDKDKGGASGEAPFVG